LQIERMINSSSYVSPSAQIGNNVEIGINSIIGSNVIIGEGSIIMSNVIIEGNTTIGKNNQIFPFACIGTNPQDLKYKGEKNQIIIGDKNIIREYVTINPGTEQGGLVTTIGNNNLFMISSHIAHDCTIGNNVIIANNVPVAGHCFIDNEVIIGGNSAVQQFCYIGKGAMIGGMTGVNKSIIPHTLATGNRCVHENLNLVGLKRKGYENSIINEYKELLENFFRDRMVIENVQISTNPLINDFKLFLIKNKNKQICYPYQK
jgi:UDP-N-acetylglucosamine acyltransferase